VRAREALSGVRGGASNGNLAGNTVDEGTHISSDILAALSGLDANRERAVAHRTRRVMQSSMGVIRERDQSKARSRAVALAVTFVVSLLIYRAKLNELRQQSRELISQLALRRLAAGADTAGL